MSWRKGVGAVNTSEPTAPSINVGITPEQFPMTPSGQDVHANQQTEKFLLLNILHNLLENNMITEVNHQTLKSKVVTQPEFDAKTIMSYAPPHWLKSITQKHRENFPSASLGSCILLLHEIGAHVGVPWRTIMTAAVLLQRYCYASSDDEDKLKREGLFLKTQTYSQRVILVASAFLLATKVEESLCKISSILAALKDILTEGSYFAAIPANTSKRTRGVHIDEDEAFAWPLRIQESVILQVLGFDVEVEHPHFYVPLLYSLPYSSASQSDQLREAIQHKSFTFLDKSVLGSKNPLTLFAGPPLVALSALFLAWYYNRESVEDKFNWDILILTPQHFEEIYATIKFLICNFSESELAQVQGWESEIPEVSNAHFYHEFISKPCRGLESIVREEVICEGTYGTVWVAKDRNTQETVALKQLKNTIGRNGFPYYMLREIMFLRRLKHPNVVSGSDVVAKTLRDGTREFYIVMEYFSFDMRDIWLAQKDFTAQPLWNEANIKHLTMQLLDAISYMHCRGLMHRDIKLENLLFDSGILKVADLGSIRDAGRTALKLTTAVVTLWYRPPELLLGNTEYTSSIDIWSIGCVIVELLTMKALFPGRDVEDMMVRITSCLGAPSQSVWQEHFARLPISANIKAALQNTKPTCPLEVILGSKSVACLDLIHRMVCYDPCGRITAEEALQHPYFKEEPLPEKYCPRQ